MSKRKRFKRKFNKFLDFEFPMLVGCLLTLFLVSCYNRAEASELRLDIDDVMLEERMSPAECLAYNAFHESRSEADISNIAIMNVVINRVQSSRFPNTICEVIKQSSQFSWTQDGKPDTIHNPKQYKRLYNLAEVFLINKESFKSISEGADHYVKVDHVTNWDYSKLIYIGRFDDHLFYKHK